MQATFKLELDNLSLIEESPDDGQFDILLGPGGQNCFKILRADNQDVRYGLKVNFESEMLVDALKDIEDESVLQDLPAPDMTGITDKYQIWESKLPFKRTIFKAFKLAVERAEEQDGKKDFVTLVSLAYHLNTEAWADIQQADSKLSQILLSDAFKDPERNQTADQIDKDSLLIFGQLHCVDHSIPMDKAINLYELL